MDNQNFSRYKGLLMILALLIILVAVLGVCDMKNVSYSGFNIVATNTVVRVYPDSPAQKAGIMKGDRMISNGGIDVRNTRSLARRPRAEIGETRTYVFERNGETVNIDLTFAGLPGRQVTLNFAVAVIGFCFLIFGLLAYFKVKDRSTTLLAFVGICFGFIFVNRPYISSYTLRMIFQSIGLIVVIFGFAFLLHFMMTFPKSKTTLKKKNATTLLYGPAVLIALFGLFLAIFQPDATSALNTITRILFGVFVVIYFGLSVIAMVHSYVKATSKERAANGLKFMLFGTIIGLAPIIIPGIINIFAPTVVLPGQDFYILTFVFIPISFALACIKRRATD